MWISAVALAVSATLTSKVTELIRKCTGKQMRVPPPIVPGPHPIPVERPGMTRTQPPRAGPLRLREPGLASTANRSLIPRQENLFLSFLLMPAPYPAPCAMISISAKRLSCSRFPPRRPPISPSRNITRPDRTASPSPIRRGATQPLMSSYSFAIQGRE